MLRYLPRILLAGRRIQIPRAPAQEWTDSSDEDEIIPPEKKNALVQSAGSSFPREVTENSETGLVPLEESDPPSEDQSFPRRSLSLVARNILMITNEEGQTWSSRSSSLEAFRGLTTENDLVQVLKNITDPKLASRIFKWAARQENFQHSVFTYNTYLNVFVKAGNPVRLRKAFDEMLNDGCFPSVYTYGIVLRGLCEAAKLDEACELIQDMESKMLTPTSFICNMLISCLCKHGRIEAAYKYFTSMISEDCLADRISYNMLTLGLCKSDQLDRALAVFSQMQRENVQPNLVTYNGLLFGFCKAGRLEQGLELLKEMIEGKKGPEIVPDSYSYNILMSGLCKANKLHTARYVLRRMIKLGCVPNVITYNTLLDGLCLARKAAEANEIFQHMIARSCDPSVVTYTILITGNSKVGDLEKSREYFMDMLRRGIQPNVHTYTSLIGGLCDAGKMEEAMEMLKQMTANGRAPNAVTYTRVVSALCRGGKADKAAKLFRESMGRFCKCRPDVFAFNTIIFGMCKNNRFAEAYEFFGEMVEMGLVGELALYRTLADGLELVSEMEKVASVCEEANKRGFVLQQLNREEEEGAGRRKASRFARGRELTLQWKNAGV